MQSSYLLAAVAAFALVLHMPVSFAQSTPAAGSTTAAPAATTPPPATATAPAATTPPAETTTAPAETKKSAGKKSAKKKMTRQQEIDHSVESGTVPSRYRSSVPREYQKYIPFDKQ